MNNDETEAFEGNNKLPKMDQILKHLKINLAAFID
jgi:hypothetical protein